MSREPPTFLARRGYRARRLEDAARALPLAGAALLLVPLVWQPEQGDAPTLPVLVYLFGVWIALLLVAAVMAAALDRATDAPEAEGSQDWP